MSYVAWTTVVSVYKWEVQVESLQNSIDDLNSIGSWRWVSIESERQISTNGSVQAIGEAVKAELLAFAGEVNVANEPLVVDSFVEVESIVGEEDEEIEEEEVEEEQVEEKVENEFSLFASADYDEINDISMDLSSIRSSSWPISHTLNTFYQINNSWILDISKSFTKIWDIKGVYLDNDNNDDFIKYENINLGDDDFKIEINARIPFDSSTKWHYLLHSWDEFKLYIKQWLLKFQKWSSTFTRSQNILTNQFNKFSIKRESNKIYLKVWDNNWENTHLSLSSDYSINNIVVWAAEVNSDTYVNQINDIIDYFKIYK